MTRIAAVETWLRDGHQPLATWREGLPASGGRTCDALIRIVTDSGAEGFCPLETWGDVAGLIVPRRIAPLAVGQDALAREALWRAVWELDRIEELPIYLLGALDVALWDLGARVAGLPLHRLLGTARTSVPAYASTATFPSVEHYLDVVDQALEAGYCAVKLHAWGDARRDADLALRLREHVGSGIDLLYDGSAAFGFADALWLGQALQDAGFGWYEEPMREFALDPYRRLTAALTIPILGAETSDGCHYTAVEWLTTAACDLVRTGWWFKGGVTGSMRIAHAADGFNRTAEVHGGGLIHAHLCCAISNTSYYEAMAIGDPVEFDPLVGRDGRVTAPDSVGAWGPLAGDSLADEGWTLVDAGAGR